MSDSTTNLDQVSQSVSEREVQINQLFDASSPASLFGRRASTCAGLVFGYYGGRFNGSSVANGTVTATASNTNYVVVARATNVVSIATATTHWNNLTDYARLYKLTAGSWSITAYEDWRASNDGSGYLVVEAAPTFIVIAPAYAATLTVDLTTYSAYTTVIVDVTLTGAVLFNLTNGTDGQVIKVRVRQDGTGSRIWTSGAALRMSADITSIVLSTTASKLDYIGFEWNGADSKADVLAINKGF